jgi:hypothetical protein
MARYANYLNFIYLIALLFIDGFINDLLTYQIIDHRQVQRLMNNDLLQNFVLVRITFCVAKNFQH